MFRSKQKYNKTQIKMLQDARVLYPALLPPTNNQPYRKNIEKWVSYHQRFASEPTLARIASKIAANINYIPFYTFIHHLKIAIADFQTKIEPNEPYIILLPHTQQFKSKIKSQHWLIGVALEYANLPFPIAIFEVQQLSEYLTKHPTINHALYIDDAIYSGAQLGESLNYIKRENSNNTMKLQIHICIPFQTTGTVERVKSEVYNDPNIGNLYHFELPTLADIFNAEEKKYFLKYFNNAEITLTYFDHKFPDHWSTLFILESGIFLLRDYTYIELCGYDLNKLDTDEGWTIAKSLVPPANPLIPKIVSPYRYVGKQPQPHSQQPPTMEINSIGNIYGQRFEFFAQLQKSSPTHHSEMGIVLRN